MSDTEDGYTVAFEARCERRIFVRSASSPEDAIAAATVLLDPEDTARMRLRPEEVVQFKGLRSGGSEIVGQFVVLGSCEDCSAVLLEGRDEGKSFATDDDDTLTFCTPCAAKVEAGQRADDPDATQVIEPPGLLLDELDGSGPGLAGGDA